MHHAHISYIGRFNLKAPSEVVVNVIFRNFLFFSGVTNIQNITSCKNEEIIK